MGLISVRYLDGPWTRCGTKRLYHATDLMQERYWGGEEWDTISEWGHEKDRSRQRDQETANERQRDGQRMREGPWCWEGSFEGCMYCKGKYATFSDSGNACHLAAVGDDVRCWHWASLKAGWESAWSMTRGIDPHPNRHYNRLLLRLWLHNRHFVKKKKILMLKLFSIIGCRLPTGTRGRTWVDSDWHFLVQVEFDRLPCRLK